MSSRFRSEKFLLVFVRHTLIEILIPRFHKVHHEFRAPVSHASEYAHPAELLIGNILPLFLGPFILRTHLFVTWSWIVLRIYFTTEVHCGYSFPFWWWNAEHGLPSLIAGPRWHDAHHERFNGNYSSTLTYLDVLFNTQLGQKK